MNITLLGHMGRDEALAERLEGHRLNVIGQWQNPGLVDKVEASGGQFHIIDSITKVEAVSEVVRSTDADMFLTNFDDALAAGVVDQVRAESPDVLIPCPDTQAFRIESDKFYLRDLIDEINPSFNPETYMVASKSSLEEAINYFKRQNRGVVIKPRNLTGGKGVKVMSRHFATYTDASLYGLQVLANSSQSGLEVQEEMTGPEFNLQILTDGNSMIRPPVTVDYPYRFDGDTGPGTGGVGTFSVPEGEDPKIITDEDYNNAMELMDDLLVKLNSIGINFRGWLYPGFMKTPSGLRIIEINARAGDPEMANIMHVLSPEVDLAEVLVDIANGKLDADQFKYTKQASAMVYLVTKEYGTMSTRAYEYGFDPELAKQMGCKVRFAASKKIGENRYKTIGSSRSIGLSALGETPWDARKKIHDAIASCFDHPLSLEYRRDVADEVYIKNMLVG